MDTRGLMLQKRIHYSREKQKTAIAQKVLKQAEADTSGYNSNPVAAASNIHKIRGTRSSHRWHKCAWCRKTPHDDRVHNDVKCPAYGHLYAKCNQKIIS